MLNAPSYLNVRMCCGAQWRAMNRSSAPEPAAAAGQYPRRYAQVMAAVYEATMSGTRTLARPPGPDRRILTASAQPWRGSRARGAHPAIDAAELERRRRDSEFCEVARAPEPRLVAVAGDEENIVRAEMSLLQRRLAGVILAQPYRFDDNVTVLLPLPDSRGGPMRSCGRSAFAYASAVAGRDERLVARAADSRGPRPRGRLRLPVIPLVSTDSRTAAIRTGIDWPRCSFCDSRACSGSE